MVRKSSCVKCCGRRNYNLSHIKTDEGAVSIKIERSYQGITAEKLCEPCTVKVLEESLKSVELNGHENTPYTIMVEIASEHFCGYTAKTWAQVSVPARPKDLIPIAIEKVRNLPYSRKF